MRRWRLRTVLIVPWLAAGCGQGAGDPDAGHTVGTQTYRVGGTVSGYDGDGLTLSLNGGDPLGVASNGSFTFPNALVAGSTYTVSVVTQPSSSGKTCLLTNATGMVGTSDVIDVHVFCTVLTPGRFVVRGTVMNLEGSGLKLENNGNDEVAVPRDATSFAFSGSLDEGAPYDVTVLQQPAGATCKVVRGVGTVRSADVSDVSVECLPNAIVLRVGNGQLPPAPGTSAPISLQEFAHESPVALRTTVPQTSFSISYSSTDEGALSRSTDKRLLSFGAYKRSPGTEAVASSAVGAARVAVTVDVNGAMQIAAEIPEATAFTEGQVRSAVTEDGTAFWMSGDGARPATLLVPRTPNGGVWYVTTDTDGTPMRVSGVPNAVRWLGIFGGQLYVSAAPRPEAGRPPPAEPPPVDPPPVEPPPEEPSGEDYIGVNRVGTGLQATAGARVTRVAGTDGSSSGVIADEPHGFAFVNADATPALEVLYIANDTVATANSVHVQKYVFNQANGRWEHRASFLPRFPATLPPVSALGVAARRLDDGTILVYATTSANQLVSFRDDGTDSPVVTLMATAPANYRFSGVALAPVTE